MRNNKSQIAIIGASGHGRVIADIAKKNGYHEICFFDDDTEIETCGGYPVIGDSSEALTLSCDVFIAIGNAEIRKKLMDECIMRAISVPTLIHPDAVIADDVQIGIGTAIMAGAVINANTIIGNGVIVNTCASVDHDCFISDYAHIAVGAHICGAVEIGEKTWVGAGCTVVNNITICAETLIGAGAVVVDNINDTGTYVGVPAKKLRKVGNL